MIRAMSRGWRNGVLAVLCVLVVAAFGWLTIVSPVATPAVGSDVLHVEAPTLHAAHDEVEASLPRRLAVEADVAQPSAMELPATANGLVVRLCDAVGAPLRSLPLCIVPRQESPVGQHVGLTDATGRLPTPFVDIAHILSLRAADPTTEAELRTRRSPTGFDVTGNVLDVSLAAWRDVELRFVDTADHPIAGVSLECTDDSRTTPNDRLVLVPYWAIPAETDADGFARFRLPEGIYALNHARTMVDLRCLGWVVVRPGEGPIRGTFVMHGSGRSRHASTRDLRVRVLGHARESEWPAVEVDVPVPRAAEGSFDAAGIVTRPIPSVECGKSIDGDLFTVDWVPPVPVTLRVTCPGYESVVQQLDATTVNVTVPLRALPPVHDGAPVRPETFAPVRRSEREERVAGVVVDRKHGLPIARAKVRFHPIANGLDYADGRYGVETSTDANGVFLCSGVFGDRWQIEVYAVGYALHDGVEKADSLTGPALRFELVHDAPLRLRVRTADAHVVPGLQIAIERNDGGLRTRRTRDGYRVLLHALDAMGRVDVDGVPGDRIWILIGHDLENRSAPRHRVELDARSIGEEIVDIVVPR